MRYLQSECYDYIDFKFISERIPATITEWTEEELRGWCKTGYIPSGKGEPRIGTGIQNLRIVRHGGELWKVESPGPANNTQTQGAHVTARTGEHRSYKVCGTGWKLWWGVEELRGNTTRRIDCETSGISSWCKSENSNPRLTWG